MFHRKTLPSAIFYKGRIYEGDEVRNIGKIQHIDRYALVNAATGEETDLKGDELKEAKRKKKVITHQAYKRRNDFVNAATGETTALQGVELKKAKENGSVITRGAYDKRNDFVNVATGKATTLKGRELEKAKRKNKVTTRQAYKQRNDFVNAATGKAISLQGVELEEAKEKFITRNAYNLRDYQNQLVDAATGEETDLKGAELKKAKEKFITRNAYNLRDYQNQLVDAATGKETDLKGVELEEAKRKKKVMTRRAYYLRNHRKRKNESRGAVSEEVSREEPKGDFKDEFAPPPSKRRKQDSGTAAAEAPADSALSLLSNKDVIPGYVNTQPELWVLSFPAGSEAQASSSSLIYPQAEETTPDHGGLETEYSVPATKRIMEKAVDMPSALLPQDPVPHIEEPFSWFAPPRFQDAVEMMELVESGTMIDACPEQDDGLDESHDAELLHFLPSDDQALSDTSIFSAAYTTGSPFVLFSERQRSPASYQPQGRKSGDITGGLIPMTIKKGGD